VAASIPPKTLRNQLEWLAGLALRTVRRSADCQRTCSFERTIHYYTVSWDVKRYPALFESGWAFFAPCSGARL
jgi:hypothetical protein